MEASCVRHNLYYLLNWIPVLSCREIPKISLSWCFPQIAPDPQSHSQERVECILNSKTYEHYSLPSWHLSMREYKGWPQFSNPRSLGNTTSNYLILPTRARHLSSGSSDLISEGIGAETKLLWGSNRSWQPASVCAIELISVMADRVRGVWELGITVN